jgi:hypothetical protein
MSSLLSVALGVAGVFSVGLGFWHVGVPRWFAFGAAIGGDGPDRPGLGTIGVGPWAYARRRSDVVGLSWVMSDAASMVLVSIGLVDLAWVVDVDLVSRGIGGAWIAAWWMLRALGQANVGRRPIDVAVATVFLGLAAIHVLSALGGR